MAKLALRTPEDVKRLFSALGEDMTHEALSMAQVDQLALVDQPVLGDVDVKSFGLSLLVAAASAWTAIEGYERNSNAILWGVGWGILGFLYPVPAVVVTAVLQHSN